VCFNEITSKKVLLGALIIAVGGSVPLVLAAAKIVELGKIFP
jgi:hypothetical protein